MVSESQSKILLDALDDERKAEAIYAAVIGKFGPVRPFSNIIEAEQRHAAALTRQLERLGVKVPPNSWAGKVAAPTSIAEACEHAIEGEIENIALYDRLIPMIADPAARQVMENLQAASRDRHLPAFKRCLDQERGRSGRRGHRRP